MKINGNFIQQQVLDAVTGRVGMEGKADGPGVFHDDDAASEAGKMRKEFVRGVRGAILGERRKLRISVKKDAGTECFPDRISLDIFGLIITDDEKCGMQTLNAAPASDGEDQLKLNTLQREFLLRLALFVLRSGHEGSEKSSVSQWTEGFQAGLQSSLRARRQ